ncbi:MAG: site-specific integrase [Nitrospirae bacterium]|nr:MAG: site-specific integrase [Nitrospirota bacterium]
MRLQQSSHSKWVFVNQHGRPYRSIQKLFQAACRNAGLSNLTPHTLQHTFASRLAMAGVDLRTIQELGGWKSLRMVKRYAHLNAKHKQEAVEKIATLFGHNSCSVSQRYSQHPFNIASIS